MDSATSKVEHRPHWRFVGALVGVRLIPPIDRIPSVVSFAQTPLGKIALLVLFGLGLSFFHHEAFYAIGFVFPLAIMTLMPEYRRFILAFAPLAATILANLGSPLLLGVTLSVIGIGILLYLCVKRWPMSPFGRRPLVFLLSGFIALIALACGTHSQTTLYTIAWTLVGVVCQYVWFIAYALTDRASSPSSDLTLQLSTFRPLWGSTHTPFPKGAAYLRRIESRSSEQLATCQLKGLKLLAWAIVLSNFSKLWEMLFHQYLRIPTSAQALASSVQGSPVAWHLRWESLILAFFESIFTISILGHQFIAICRMAGFNALRNTYKPVFSTTISEFFNRYYYYFKELLVDFFFYPTFLRFFKRRKKIRLVFATFAAALFGNTLYHFTRDWHIIRDHGLAYAMWSYEASLVYCFVLSCGLSISELRTRRPRRASIFRGRLMPAAGVALFYCLLNVFMINERGYALTEYLRFIASLFFLHF